MPHPARRFVPPILLLLICVFLTAAATAQTPNYQHKEHDNGQVGLTITNWGIFGSGFIEVPVCDGFCSSAEFPLDSKIGYLYTGAIWVGSLSGNDTLVSVGHDGWAYVTEMQPDPGPAGAIYSRSSDPGSPDYSPLAVAEIEYEAIYTDTFTNSGLTGLDPVDSRSHRPLKLQITQTSYSWSDPGIDDFVMFRYRLRNIGPSKLYRVWVGIYIDGDAHHLLNGTEGYLDDISGYLDDPGIAYIMDNDGDPESMAWTSQSPRGVMGMRLHDVFPAAAQHNFNWWRSHTNSQLDFGPRLAGTPEYPFRSFGDVIGTPMGDRNKYYILRHDEFDYNQLYTSLDNTGDGFLPTPLETIAKDVANGIDTKFLYSFGPFDIPVDDSVLFYFSMVMGDGLHVDPTDYDSLYFHENPLVYYSALDFSDLIVNSNAADSLYDLYFKTPTDVDDFGHDALPSGYALSDNYPNPFNPATTIAYTVPRQTHVELAVYDILGRRIITLVDGSKTAGGHTAQWSGNNEDGSPVASGIYFYMIKTDDFVQAKKMVLMK
jgi:hypothetical protein